MEEGGSFKIWGRLGGMDLKAGAGSSCVWFVERYSHGMGGFQQKLSACCWFRELIKVLARWVVWGSTLSIGFSKTIWYCH